MTGLGSNYASVESDGKTNANFELYLSRSPSAKAALQHVSIIVHIYVYGKCPDSLLKTARPCFCFRQGSLALLLWRCRQMKEGMLKNSSRPGVDIID